MWGSEKLRPLARIIKLSGTFTGAPGTGPGPGGSWPAGTHPGMFQTCAVSVNTEL